MPRNPTLLPQNTWSLKTILSVSAHMQRHLSPIQRDDPISFALNAIHIKTAFYIRHVQNETIPNKLTLMPLIIMYPVLQNLSETKTTATTLGYSQVAVHRSWQEGHMNNNVRCWGQDTISLNKQGQALRINAHSCKQLSLLPFVQQLTKLLPIFTKYKVVLQPGRVSVERKTVRVSDTTVL